MTNKTIGVIDVGSNSVRLIIQKNGQTTLKLATVTRLSKNITKSGELSPESIKRTVTALSFFVDKAKTYGVNDVKIFATAGVRLAKNKNEFLDAVKKQLGIIVDVVSGEEEAELGVLGALNGCDGGFIDLGGKSTEIAQIFKGDKIFCKSLNLGVVTLTEKFFQDVKKCRRYCHYFLRNNLKRIKNQAFNFVAVGGTATTLSAISLNLKSYDRSLVDNFVLTKKALRRVIILLKKVSVEDRLNKFCIQNGREDVILLGAVFLLEILKFLKIKSVTVKESDNLEGYILKRGLNNE